MAGETTITVIGNLTADPELRYTPNGTPVANVTIASTPRVYERQAGEWKDGEAMFLRATLWRDLAEHAAKSLGKGARVVVVGDLRQHSFQDKDGTNRSSLELDVQEIGPSLRFATAAVSRTQASDKTQASASAEWAAPVTEDADPPF